MTAVPITAIEDRTRFIGGSDVAAILGVDPYKTRLQVWEEKVGLATPFVGNAHTARGNRLEEVAAEEFTLATGRKLHRVNSRITHLLYPFISARIDRRVVGEQTVAEIKCPSLGAFSKIKRTGLHEGYIAQMQHYIGLTGYAGGVWIIFCADQWDFITFPMEPDAELIGDMERACVSFWRDYVEKRVAPPATIADEERIEIARIAGEKALYEVDQDEAFLASAAMLREAKALAKEAAAVEEEAVAQMKALAGDRRGVFVGPGFSISYSDVAGRSTFDKKALAAAKPLDGMQVGRVLADALGPDVATRLAVDLVDKARLDLAQFEKLGKPYTTLRPRFFGDDA